MQNSHMFVDDLLQLPSFKPNQLVINLRDRNTTSWSGLNGGHSSADPFIKDEAGNTPRSYAEVSDIAGLAAFFKKCEEWFLKKKN